jgi:serine/threonine-protein kinase
LTDSSSLPEGTLIAGKLRVVRLLGMGGMGAVYEVEHEFTRHRRALKMLHRELLSHPSIVARFLREASAAGHIGNPHIVETFDAGTLDTGEPYIVMEMLHGETLDARLARLGRLPLGELVDILGQACDAVDAAHAAGIVHRDLKPENLFLLDPDGRPFVKVLDFGISKFDATLTGSHGTTKEGTALGTPFYMSPEQVNGDKNLDARTDIYALGVILYECSSGQRPFVADALPRLSVLIHEGTPPSLLEREPALPPAFVDVVSRAMAKDKNQRFASAHELGVALAPFGAQALNATLPESALVRRAITSRPPSRRVSSRPSVSPAVIERRSAPYVALSAPPPSRVVVETPSSRLQGEDRAVIPTMEGSVRSVSLERSRGKWIAVSVGGACLLAGALAAVKVISSAGGDHGPSSHSQAQAGSPISASAPSPPFPTAAIEAPPPSASLPSLSSAAVLSPAPSATVATAPPSSARSVTPPVAVAAPKPSASASSAKPPAPPPVRPPASSRVDQTGLAGDNPFK